MRTRLALGLGIGLVLLALGVFLVLRGGESLQSFNQAVEQVEAIDSIDETRLDVRGEEARALAARLPGFTLPAAAHDVYLGRQGDSPPWYWLRFDLLADDLDAFLATTCLSFPGELPLFAYDTPDVYILLDWWTPEYRAGVIGGQCSPRPEVTLTVWVEPVETRNQRIWVEIVPG